MDSDDERELDALLKEVCANADLGEVGEGDYEDRRKVHPAEPYVIDSAEGQIVSGPPGRGWWLPEAQLPPEGLTSF